MNTKAIQQATAHRPWPLRSKPWAFYQEWNRAFFLHWRVPHEWVQPMIPRGTALDTFDGSAWVSLVAFTMEKIRPRQLPPWPLISNFHEVNVRTYVTAENKPGIFFLSIEAGKRVSAWISAKVSGLNYEYASMQRMGEKYTSLNTKRNYRLDAHYAVGKPILQKSPLDIFLTEKYCLYMEKAGRPFRYEVHHQPWDLYHTSFSALTTDYTIGDCSLQSPPHLVHYSPGVQVLAWTPDPVPTHP